MPMWTPSSTVVRHEPGGVRARQSPVGDEGNGGGVVSLMTEPFADKVRRDQWGRYKVLPPNGTKPVGYTRATTVAKALDDTSNLMDWSCRMTAIGLAARPDLLALVATATDDKKALNGICERAKEAGGATARRDLGTALHSMIEQSYTTPGYAVPQAYAADVEAVHAALAAAGYTVVADMHERMVVMDRYQIAGTFDLVLRDAAGVLHVADVKTGASISYGALGFAVQLAIYANASALYTQGAKADGSQDTRTEMPEVDKGTAVVVHVEPGSGKCDLHHLDIAAGAEALETAMAVRGWRTRKGLLVPVTASSNGTQAPPSAEKSTTAPAEAACGNEHTPTVEQQLPPLADTAVSVLNGRIDDLRKAGRVALLKAHWPAGVAIGKVTATHTADDVAAILTAIVATERNEFPPDTEERAPKAAAPAVEPLMRPTPDEGGPLDPDRAATIKAVAANKKEANVRSWNKVSALLSDLRQIGHRLDMTAPTVRTGALLEAVMALAEWDDVDTQRAMLARVTGCDQALHPATKVAEFISTLTIAEANALHALCTSDLRVAVDADGRVVLEVAA